jgi:hypothetical protein
MLSGIPWSRKAVCGLAIVAASYLVATFANASPVTQPSFAGATFRTPVVVTAPPAVDSAAEGGALKAGSPENRGREFERVSNTAVEAI